MNSCVLAASPRALPPPLPLHRRGNQQAVPVEPAADHRASDGWLVQYLKGCLKMVLQIRPRHGAGGSLWPVLALKRYAGRFCSRRPLARCRASCAQGAFSFRMLVLAQLLSLRAPQPQPRSTHHASPRLGTPMTDETLREA